MAFPQTALPVVVELDLVGDGSFSTNLTTVTNAAGRRVVRMKNGIVITRGKASGTDSAPPATCRLTLDNSDGRFSPRKPTGPYYGSLRRNTPIRVSITSATSWLQVTAATGATPAAGARVTCPDSANLSIVGDLDLRFDADLDAWRGTTVDLVGKWGSAGNQSYIMTLESTGLLGLFWSTNGTNLLFTRSNAVLPRQTGRLAVRAVLDVDNGGGGYTVAFYYSDSLSGSWTLLGDALGTSSGITSIFDSTSVCTVLDTASGSQANVVHGRVYGAQILQGIGGTVRASPDFTAQTHGATSFADAQSNTWTLAGDVELTTRDVRFVGEVSAWPVAWDLSQRNVETEIEASGVLRRLQQGQSPLGSAMRRSLSARPDAVAYWPLEDGSDSRWFASAVDEGRQMKWAEASPQLASDEQFLCSDPLPTANGSRYTGVIPYYSHTGAISLQWLWRIPAAQQTDRMLVRLSTAFLRWDIVYTDPGTLNLQWYQPDGTFIDERGPVAFAVDDRLLWMTLDLTQVGGNVSYALAQLEVGDATGVATSGTATGVTMGRATAVRTGHLGHDPAEVTGHFVVTSSVYSIYNVFQQLNAFIGEQAHDRIKRLCAESGVVFAGYGPANGTPMGPQKSMSLTDLLRQAEESDAGLLFEPRDQLGLAFRTRRSLHTQWPTLALNYAGRTLSELIPVDDDDALRNDVTVSRINGSSARSIRNVGALSVNPPPDGVGPYPATYELNVENDLDVADHASWRLSQGTVDEARYPVITVNLAAPVIAASTSLTTALRRLDVGDRLVIQNPPAWLPPDEISQLAVGFTETLGPKEHRIEINCVPESPYRVGIFDSASGPTETRAAGRDKRLGVSTITAEALDTTETGVDITCPSAFVRWGHADGDYEVVVGGEVMTVTAVTGATASQTLTVIRSVNGVVKSHAIGATVELADPRRYGLI